jgi:hypothetical protein
MQFDSWREEIKYLHLAGIQKKSPGFFKASGGFDMKIKPYSDSTTNGLTTCVKAFLEFKGHYCIRTSRQGQARIERLPIGGTQQDITGKGVKYSGKISYTKNPEEKAFSDLHASIHGLFLSIEIKCAATKDRFKKGSKQDENKMHVEKSGGLHLVVRTMDQFWSWYYYELPAIIKSKLNIEL